MKFDFDITTKGERLDFEFKDRQSMGGEGSGLSEDEVKEIITEQTKDLQPKQDESLPTESKEIVGAIKELYDREDKQGLSENQVKEIVSSETKNLPTDIDAKVEEDKISLTLILKNISAPLDLIKEKIDQSGIDSSYFKVAIKALGIGYITSFVAEACRDAGQNSLALKAELAGKCAIFILSVPLILSILETTLGFSK